MSKQKEYSTRNYNTSRILFVSRKYCKPARLTTNVITEHGHLLFTDAHLAGFTVGPKHLYAPVTGTDQPIYTYY